MTPFLTLDTALQAYDAARHDYDRVVRSAMSEADHKAWHEAMFSAHSCAIEGNTFSVDDTRQLMERGLDMVPCGHTLVECLEMADHLRAYEYVAANQRHPLDEELLRETNRLLTLHTLDHRAPGAVPGAYTTVDMAAGDTVFGPHEQLVARVPALLHSTAEALQQGRNPMLVAARFHGFFIYLHPFRDGNGRTARLISNHILLAAGHPPYTIRKDERPAYIAALRQIRTERTDEHLIFFFLTTAAAHLREAVEQKQRAARHPRAFLF